MKTSTMIVIGAAAAAGVGFVLWRRSSSGATRGGGKPINGAPGGEGGPSYDGKQIGITGTVYEPVQSSHLSGGVAPVRPPGVASTVRAGLKIIRLDHRS